MDPCWGPPPHPPLPSPPFTSHLTPHASRLTHAQVAEGVATAGAVVLLARRYKVSLPVLTAVANVCDAHVTPSEAVRAVMNLPQMEDK